MKKRQISNNKNLITKHYSLPTALLLAIFYLLFIFSCENHWIIELTDHMYPELHEPVVVMTHIEADYNQTGTVYTFTPRDSLKGGLLVKAFFDDGTFITVDAADYTLSGTLDAGTSVITVSYGGKTVTFDVTVTAAPTDSKAITAFTFDSPPATGVIDEDAKTISVTAPYGTSVASLTPTVMHTGASYSPSGAQDFTGSVTYTVTAEDGSVQEYTVTVTVAPANAKAVTAFAFTSPAAAGMIDEDAKTISVTVPHGTSVTGLTPTVTHTGASCGPEGAQNFTGSVVYTVTAADGSTQDYTVTVTVALSDAKAITEFAFTSPSAAGVINESAKTIGVNVPYGTSVTSLTPDVTHTGVSYSPAGAQNFTGPVVYTVTAEDGSTQEYTVTVTVTPSNAKAVTEFTFDSPSATGTINESAKTISVNVPYGTNVTNLTPNVTHTGASYSPAGAQDFTSPVTYTVTAADGSVQNYTVTVMAAGPVWIDGSGGAANIHFDNLQAALASITANGTYTVRVAENQSLAGHNNNAAGAPGFLGITGAHITLIGVGSVPVEIRLSSAGRMFTVSGSNVSLTLGENITLVGRTQGVNGATTNNSNALVRVEDGGAFTMLDGSKITGNTSIGSSAGVSSAVTVTGTTGFISSFTMNGGEITGNNATAVSAMATGGLYVMSNTSVKLNGGSISGNTGVSGDIFLTAAVNNFELSEDAEIGNIYFVLNAATNYAFINIAPQWSGNIQSINLVSNHAVNHNMETTISSWSNKNILRGGGVNAAAIGRVGLGNFRDSDGNIQSITAPHPPAAPYGYRIADSGADIGRLVGLIPGSGTEGDPFLISSENWEQVIGPTGTIHNNLDKHYKLEADIVLDPLAPGGSNWTRIGTDTNNRFTGTFDGGGHTITGITINATTDNQGMFGYIGEDGEVKNLGLVDVNISGRGNIGGLAGRNYGTVQNTYATGSVSSVVIGTYSIGGLVGSNYSIVQNSYAAVNVSGGSSGYSGGLVGDNNNGIVRNSYAAGSVSGRTSGSGLVGFNGTSSSTVQNSVALNPAIMRTDETRITFARVTWNAGIINNNYGRADMFFIDGSTPQANFPSPAKNANGKDGADVSATTNTANANGGYHNIAFWRSVFTDFDTHWEWNSTTNLPILRGFEPGTQNPRVIDTITLPDGFTQADLQNAISNSPPGSVITLPPGTATNIDAVSVDREITISAPPGENVTLSRPTTSGNETPGFIIESGGKLILEGGSGTLTLSTTGGNSTTDSLIRVRAGGELLIKEGVTLIGNNLTFDSTNAINVDGGVLNMTGGTISNFRRYGAVRINNGGIFNMSGGKLTGNSWGAAQGGGAVDINNGTFTMSGTAEISGNYTVSAGGGVRVRNGGTFNMQGGTISNNYAAASSTANSQGGGVFVENGGAFNMEGGTVGGNYIVINSANNYGQGGGISVENGGDFIKTGGTIYGVNADSPDWNRIMENPAPGEHNERGHAVYVGGATPRLRNTTAGPGVNLNSGTDDGWGE